MEKSPVTSVIFLNTRLCKVPSAISGTQTRAPDQDGTLRNFPTSADLLPAPPAEDNL